jgi:hypothetical protein
VLPSDFQTFATLLRVFFSAPLPIDQDRTLFFTS